MNETTHHLQALERVRRKLLGGAFGGHFGGCPFCGDSDGPYITGRADWLCCVSHRVRWCIGENLFRKGRFQSPEEREATNQWLGQFETVEPVYLPDLNEGKEAGKDEC